MNRKENEYSVKILIDKTGRELNGDRRCEIRGASYTYRYEYGKNSEGLTCNYLVFILGGHTNTFPTLSLTNDIKIEYSWTYRIYIIKGFSCHEAIGC